MTKDKKSEKPLAKADKVQLSIPARLMALNSDKRRQFLKKVREFIENYQKNMLFEDYVRELKALPAMEFIEGQAIAVVKVSLARPEAPRAVCSFTRSIGRGKFESWFRPQDLTALEKVATKAEVRMKRVEKQIKVLQKDYERKIAELNKLKVNLTL